MPTAPTTPTPFPVVPPSSQDPANFDSRMDATLAHLPTLQDEMFDLADNAFDNATEAQGSATAAATSQAQASSFASAASASASAAATATGAPAFVSGTNYTAGTSTAVSLVDFRVYRARTTGVRTTDPANDPTNWAIAGGELVLITVSGTTQTAAVGGRYALRNAGATVLTAPPSPQAGDRFAVKVANGLTTNTINWNGGKHEGLSDTTSSMERAGFAAEFVYIDATYGWGII